MATEKKNYDDLIKMIAILMANRCSIKVHISYNFYRVVEHMPNATWSQFQQHNIRLPHSFGKSYDVWIFFSLCNILISTQRAICKPSTWFYIWNQLNEQQMKQRIGIRLNDRVHVKMVGLWISHANLDAEIQSHTSTIPIEMINASHNCFYYAS